MKLERTTTYRQSEVTECRNKDTGDLYRMICLWDGGELTYELYKAAFSYCDNDDGDAENGPRTPAMTVDDWELIESGSGPGGREGRIEDAVERWLYEQEHAPCEQ